MSSSTITSVCVFGSSSRLTRDLYVQESIRLGEEIAKRGLLCVNGAGHTGCMGGVNKGCETMGGAVRGVIHEKFCVDFGEHPHIKDLVMSKGADLSERKQALLDHADCILVLPGGVGTFDEFWDCVCGKSLGMKGMTKKPVVIVNIDGFYDGFLAQMHRAHADGILYGSANSYFHVEQDPIRALDWCMATAQNNENLLHDTDALLAGIKQNNVDDNQTAEEAMGNGNSDSRLKVRVTASAESTVIKSTMPWQEYFVDMTFIYKASMPLTMTTFVMGLVMGIIVSKIV